MQWEDSGSSYWASNLRLRASLDRRTAEREGWDGVYDLGACRMLLFTSLALSSSQLVSPVMKRCGIGSGISSSSHLLRLSGSMWYFPEPGTAE